MANERGDWLSLCLTLVKRAEGCRLQAYADPEPAGIRWTIGYGATGPDIDATTVWTQAQADADLVDRLTGFNRSVTQAVRVRISAQQRAALVSLIYNIGTGEFLASTLLRLLNAGNTIAAMAQFQRWNADDGKIERGLIRRRIAETQLFDQGTP